MKSLNEWQADLIAEELGISPIIARSFMGGDATIHVDPMLKSKLRGKLEQLRQSPEYADVSPEEFFRGVVAAAWSIVGDISQSSFSIGTGIKKFGDKA